MNNFFPSNSIPHFLPLSVPTEARGGWIYIMSTASDENRVKIGKTTKNPLIRLAALRCSDPYLGMIGAFFIPHEIKQINHVETLLHVFFEEVRINFHEPIHSNGDMHAFRLDEEKFNYYSEWFGINTYEAVELICDALAECLGVSCISLSDRHSRGAYPTKLAFYNLDMLIEIYG